jgi:hypothetical protein
MTGRGSSWPPPTDAGLNVPPPKQEGTSQAQPSGKEEMAARLQNIQTSGLKQGGMWHIHPVPGNDHVAKKYTASLLSNGFANRHVSTATRGNSS